ncbi:disease resistance protein PIK6-NP-like [Triticum aestivum]|uniref:disease resistance protein PIK6-NP-like n=1 Tax=Triticum aestivum TaxID=4565 RepID=UPI001D02278D|nr:disease resistance protein PIK6-NP-like [Triticum aestivum]
MANFFFISSIQILSGTRNTASAQVSIFGKLRSFLGLPARHTTMLYARAASSTVRVPMVEKISPEGHGQPQTLPVFKETVNFDEQYPELAEQADLILRMCRGQPLAIVTTATFLANQPKTLEEWRRFNEQINDELEMNTEVGVIRALLSKCYDGLPYHLKSCLLHMSIFLQDQKVSRRRLVRRWTAEGYSRVVRARSVEETRESYFMELISRGMILPTQQSFRSTKGIDSCQVHDMIRGIGNSKSVEANLVFRLEEGCSLDGVGTVRHLAVSWNWEEDQSEFESIVGISHTRSLTIFGKWRPFFISEKTRLLQVLDLEDTSGLVDHHLEHIGILLHLRYLSLRGCLHIYHLPGSVGNLRQLQTLDIAGTSIFKLPGSIVKLSKLQHILAGAIRNQDDNDDDFETSFEDVPKLTRNRLCFLTCSSVALCVGCCASRTACCCSILPAFARHQCLRGVAVPRGFHKLKALHTLGAVNIASGKAALEDLSRLGGLRKLRVTGINKRNSKEFCSTIAHLRCLESLSMQSAGKPGLSACLDGLRAPPKNLQSLKFYGNMVTLPGWVKGEGLKNLVKLKLQSSRMLLCDAAVEVLGSLPKLAILRLWKESFDGNDIRVTFHQDTFPSLVLLELDRVGDLRSVKFEQGATAKLELLQFRSSLKAAHVGLFSGLRNLLSFKEFKLVGTYEHNFVADLQEQLACNFNRPAFKTY